MNKKEDKIINELKSIIFNAIKDGVKFEITNNSLIIEKDDGRTINEILLT